MQPQLRHKRDRSPGAAICRDLILPLLAAMLLGDSGCGRLGYDEHRRTPSDGGREQPADEDGGE